MKKIVIAAIICLVISSALFGQDLGNLGFNILSTGSEDEFTVVRAEDPGSGLIVDIYYLEFNQSRMEFLRQAKNIILSWRYLVPKEIKIFFQPEQVEIRVNPESFVYQGNDYSDFIPSTVSFYYANTLEYDFRILVENITLRVRGPYFNEDQLAAKLKSAVENPVAYIQSNDPEYIVRRLGEISGDMETLKAENTDARAKIASLEERLELAVSALEELTESYSELSDSVSDTLKNLKLGTIAVSNQGLFSSIKDFNKEAVEQAIALKTENPSFSEDELLAACKDQGIKITPKEIHIIFKVYFNEF